VGFWTSLDQVRARHDVLQHPFYLRWSAGELKRAELAHYASQYRYAVIALADAAAGTAASVDRDLDFELREELNAHAREEAAHVGLWDGFCSAVGASVCDAPTPETQACAHAWAGDGRRALGRSLVALHVIEAAQPAIAATKRAGLIEHYAVQDGPATAYFELHERLDVEHAAASRNLIEKRLAGVETGPQTEAEVESLLSEAESVLRGNWLLLDGVERTKPGHSARQSQDVPGSVDPRGSGWGISVATHPR
jgi:pyrroloquinoline-quinone synthase